MSTRQDGIIRWGEDGGRDHSAIIYVYYDPAGGVLRVADEGAQINNGKPLSDVLDKNHKFVNYIAEFRQIEKVNEDGTGGKNE